MTFLFSINLVKTKNDIEIIRNCIAKSVMYMQKVKISEKLVCNKNGMLWNSCQNGDACKLACWIFWQSYYANMYAYYVNIFQFCCNNKMVKINMLILYQLWIKVIYSEKATKFFKIDLSYVVPVKSKVKISKNFVAFSEYMNF